jgi:meso-butanediol dehydrogenase/(S,S)-butanediol dehydrogenase/diacetyl reductase
MMPRLAGKVAFVTGGAQGIGRAIAERFCAEGARVAVLDTDGAAALALQRELGAERCDSVIADVSAEGAVGAAVSRCVARFGRLDILINNAYASARQSVTDLLTEDWDRTVDVSLSGMFYTCRAAIPHMRRQGGGAIVNISSVQAHFPVAGGPAYAAAKAGVLGLTRQLAVEYGPDKIRANSISPGFIATEAVNLQILSDENEARAVADSTPLGRAGHPDEVGAVAAFLASDEAAFVTGIDIIVDGGVTAQWPMMLLRPSLRQKARIGTHPAKEQP